MADDETVALVLAGRLEEEQFNIYDLTKKEEEPTELIKGSDLGPM